MNTATYSLEQLQAVMEDAITFYSENPLERRGYSDVSGCSYSTFDVPNTYNKIDGPDQGAERCCVVGRLLTPEERAYVRERGWAGCSVSTLLSRACAPDLLDLNALPKEATLASLAPYPEWFLEAMQGFHDQNNNFTATGLTARGQEKAAHLREWLVERYTNEKEAADLLAVT